MTGLKARVASGLVLGISCVFLALAGGWFIFVPLLSIYFFGEQLNMRFYIGASLIVLGLWTIHS